jgi:hypothetical protein
MGSLSYPGGGILATDPRVNEVVNAKAEPYNAIGDGTADDSAAIQAAVNAAGDAGGGWVYLPKGVYRGQDIAMRDYVGFLGANRDAAILRLRSDSSESIFSMPTDATSPIELALRDLTLDGAKASTSVPAGTLTKPLLNLNKVSRLHISHVTVKNSRGKGIELAGNPAGGTGPQEDIYMDDVLVVANGLVGLIQPGLAIRTSRRCRLVGVVVKDGEHGFLLCGRNMSLDGCHSINNRGFPSSYGFAFNAASDPLNTTAEESFISATGCTANNNDGSGFYVQQSFNQRTYVALGACISRANGTGFSNAQTGDQMYLSISGGIADRNAGSGVLLQACTRAAISGLISEANGDDGIQGLDQLSAAISGCEIRNNGRDGIRSTGTSNRWAYSGNVIRGNLGVNENLVGANNARGANVN